MDPLEILKNWIPSEWEWIHTNLELFVAILIVIGVFLPALTLLWWSGVLITKVLPRCLTLAGWIFRKSVGCLRSVRFKLKPKLDWLMLGLKGYNDQWRYWRLKKGWRHMKVNLGHIVTDLQRDGDVDKRKSCVAIRLNGLSLALDENGRQTQWETTFVGHIVGHQDRAILINAHARSSEKYTLFLANVASALVDGWDEMHDIAKLQRMNKAEREQFVNDAVAWLMNYEIPHKVLMDYLGDALDCQGEWV